MKLIVLIIILAIRLMFVLASRPVLMPGRAVLMPGRAVDQLEHHLLSA